MKDEETTKELIFAAEYLLLVSLKTRAGRFLKQNLTSTNCISTLRFAQKYRCDELVDNCTKFIHDNFASVAESDEFLKLEAEEVEKWISSENICVPDEEDMFRIILKWIEQDKSKRKAKFEKLFRHIRLASLSRDYLLNVVTNELVVENVSCSRQVVDAIKLVITASEDTLVQSTRRIETHAIAVRGGKNSYCYLPEKETWKLMESGFSEDRNHTTQLIRCRNQVYSFPKAFYADTERYDPAFNSWAKIKLFPGDDDCSFAVLGEKSMLSAALVDAIHLLLKDMMRSCVSGKLFNLHLTFNTAEIIHVLSTLATVCMFLGVANISRKLVDTTL